MGSERAWFVLARRGGVWLVPSTAVTHNSDQSSHNGLCAQVLCGTGTRTSAAPAAGLLWDVVVDGGRNETGSRVHEGGAHNIDHENGIRLERDGAGWGGMERDGAGWSRKGLSTAVVLLSLVLTARLANGGAADIGAAVAVTGGGAAAGIGASVAELAGCYYEY